MSLLIKMLKQCDKSILLDLGFTYKKDKFYRLLGRCLQTIIFSHSHITYDTFMVYFGISFLSDKIDYDDFDNGTRKFTFYELSGVKVNDSYNTDFYYERNSFQETEIELKKIFTMAKEIIIPILDQITDERTYIELGESMAEDGNIFFFSKLMERYDYYAYIGNFEKAFRILDARMKKNAQTTAENYDYFKKFGKHNEAEECIKDLKRLMSLHQPALDAIRNHNAEYFQNIADENEKYNVKYINDKLKIQM